MSFLIFSQISETAESLNWLVVDIDILDLWLFYSVGKSLLEDFLLVHLHLRLIFLYTDMNTVNEDVLIDDLCIRFF